MQRGSIKSNRERTRLYRMVVFIGRWSMLDVFVDTFTVALVQLQPLMSVAAGSGVLFFAAVVVLTMLAAESFDPRLIWDSANPGELSAMPNENDLNNLPQATVSHGRSASDYRSSGSSRSSRRWSPSESQFSASATKARPSPLPSRALRGIEAGKTFIKYKDVTIGHVTTVQLSDDYTKVMVTAEIDKHAEGPDRRGREVLGRRAAGHSSGISGLDTLLSGQYIGFQNGTSLKRRARLHRARRGAGRSPTSRASDCSSPPVPWDPSESARRSTIAACRSVKSRATNSPPMASPSSHRFSSTRRTTST